MRWQYCSDLEHLSCALAITCGDNGRVYILEATLLEELVSCVSQIVANARY